MVGIVVVMDARGLSAQYWEGVGINGCTVVVCEVNSLSYRKAVVMSVVVVGEAGTASICFKSLEDVLLRNFADGPLELIGVGSPQINGFCDVRRDWE